MLYSSLTVYKKLCIVFRPDFTLIFAPCVLQNTQENKKKNPSLSKRRANTQNFVPNT